MDRVYLLPKACPGRPIPAKTPYPYLLQSGSNNTGGELPISEVFLPVDNQAPKDIFNSSRWDIVGDSEMEYAFPAPQEGDYEVRLYFGNNRDINTNPIFDVSAEDTIRLDAFDPITEFGQQQGGMKSFITYVNDGTLNLQFKHDMSDNPMVSGIEVIRVNVEETIPPTADVQVMAGSTKINASTYNAKSFVITNTSQDDQSIQSVTFDLSTNSLPEIVYDPDGKAGDKVAKGFTPDEGTTETGYLSHQLLDGTSENGFKKIGNQFQRWYF
ncbi:MAG: hypothetical protein HC880_01415 [Bacteroidia bacterium]|nr:hypothetical protein [Bacteroidia bacterium]